MHEQPVIMVQVAEPSWTCDVLYAACKLARACSGTIELVLMVRAKHLSYLGSELGYLELNEEAEQSLQAYADTAEDYGITCGVTLYQYCTLYEAIVGAADLVRADVVFAKLPKSIIPFWSDCQFELLRVRLSRQHIELYKEPGVWNAIMPKLDPGQPAAHAFS
jgi:hypothetical protein